MCWRALVLSRRRVKTAYNGGKCFFRLLYSAFPSKRSITEDLCERLHLLQSKYPLKCNHWKKNWLTWNERKLTWTSLCSNHFSRNFRFLISNQLQTMSSVGIQLTLHANRSAIYILLVRDLGWSDWLLREWFGVDCSELWLVQIVFYQGE